MKISSCNISLLSTVVQAYRLSGVSQHRATLGPRDFRRRPSPNHFTSDLVYGASAKWTVLPLHTDPQWFH